MKVKSPQIGLRTLKTIIAVFICFSIDEFRNHGVPFYSAIAAILCIQRNHHDSIAEAKNREIATIVGGSCGALFLLCEKYVYRIPVELLRYFVLSLMLVFIIQISLLLQQKKGTYLMCVVFLCVTVTHGDDMSLVAFALDRMIDTTIGIVVALCINIKPSFFRKDNITPLI